MMGWWRFRQRGDVLGIVAMTIILAVFGFVLVRFPGHLPFGPAANWNFSPEWRCYGAPNGPSLDPVCVRTGRSGAGRDISWRNAP